VTEPDVLDSGRAGGLAIRGGALRTLSYFAAMLLSLASVPFMTRHLGEVDYGYYVTVSSIVFIIGGATEAGLTNLGMREYAVREGRARVELMRNLVGLRLVLTVVGVAIAVALTTVTGAGEVIVIGTAITGTGLLLTLTQQTYTVSLSAQLKLGWVAALELIKHFTLSASIVALVILGASLVPFFFATVLAGLVMLGCTLILLRDEAGLLPAFHPAEWRHLLRAVLPYAIATAVGLVYFRLAIILMHYIAADEQTGLYAAAFRIVETVGVIPWLLVSSGFPILARAARDDESRLRYAVQRLFEVSTVLGIGVALAVAVGAPFAIEVVAGDEFEGAVPVLRLQALSLLTSFLVATWLYALLSLDELRALVVSFVIAAVMAAALTFALVPSLEAEGAALATFGAEAILAIALLVSLVRRHPNLRPSLGVIPRLLVPLGAAGAIALLVPAPSVVLAVLATAVYLGLAFVFRAVPSELVNAMLRRDPPLAG
jgi:O-antigen/teichoic acid export membrane protein